MKTGVAATGGSLDAEVSEQFGRCAFFVIVDSETMKFEAMTNPAASASGGAGPMAAQELVNRDVELVIAGRLGPKAEQALNSAGVKFVSGSGKVRDAVAAAAK
jgi:predicted Fe-Mo cluster-binding NifX family protein